MTTVTPGQNQRIEFIDFAKGFAMLSIVLFHYSQPYVSGIWAKAIMLGGSGVHLFFVLSGFGLGLSQKKPGVVEFYLKRASKILVPYFLVILIIYGINLVLPLYSDAGLYALFGHLFLYKMFDENIMTSFGYHFWFMSTIVQFYIAYPLIAMVREKINMTAFIFASLLISVCYWIAISYYGVADQRVFNSFFLQFLWEFNLGIVLASLYRQKNVRLWEQSLFVLASVTAVGMSLMALMALKGGQVGQTFNDIPSSIGIFALAAFIYSICGNHLAVIKETIARIGSFSYEWYLTHMIVYLLAVLLLSKVLSLESNIFISILVIVPTSLFVASLFSHFVMKLWTHWFNFNSRSTG